jgi:deoxyribodipyrimidine photo-lyase
VQVETDVVVPLETASEKEEYAAYTIRPKIHEHLDRFLVPLEETLPERHSLAFDKGNVDLSDISRVLDDVRISRSADAVETFHGGASNAEALLDSFIASKLHCYAERRNEPGEDYVSHMSPYLHFGQISPLHIVGRVSQIRAVDQENKDAYLEELVVRRELSMNFCHYNPHYDSLACLPNWAKKTLEEHAGDRREHVYSLNEFDKARTHDPYWNAAQREMVLTGKMHGYMRMYWGKKILEWTPAPDVAHRIALELNNRYEIDGRDPNGYTGVAWCFGKHDRAWAEREIYGKVRYMSAGGLERKFDIDRYVRHVLRLTES